MALSFIQQPTDIVAAGHPIELVLSSTNSTLQKVRLRLFKQTNVFTFIAEWIVDRAPGIGANFRFRIDDLVQDNLGFDLPDMDQTTDHRIIESAISMFNVTADGLDDSGNVISSEHVDSNFAVVLNASLDAVGVPDIRPYYIEQADKYLLSHAAVEKPVAPTDREYLSFITSTGIPLTVVYQVKLNGQAGLSSFEMQYSTSLRKILELNTGLHHINFPHFFDQHDNVEFYELYVLAALGANDFVDGLNGSFEGGIPGMVSMGSAPVALSNTQRNDGNFSMQATLNSTDAVNYSGLWSHSTTLQLKGHTRYRVVVYRYHESDTGPVQNGNIRLSLDGFTDATYTPVEAWIDSRENLGQFMPMVIDLETGFDTTGTLVMEQRGNFVKGMRVYFDSISVLEVALSPMLRRYTVDRACHLDSTRVHFRNRLGVIDSFTFTGTSKRKLATGGSTFEQQLAATSGPSSRGKTDLIKEGMVELTCSTDAIDAKTAGWLEELLTSPNVYIEHAGALIPVILKTGSYETVDRVQNFQRLIVKLLLANPYRSQRN